MSFYSSKILLPVTNWQIHQYLYDLSKQSAQTMSVEQVNMEDPFDEVVILPENQPNDDPARNLLDQLDEESRGDGDHGT